MAIRILVWPHRLELGHQLRDILRASNAILDPSEAELRIARSRASLLPVEVQVLENYSGEECLSSCQLHGELSLTDLHEG